MSSAIDKGKRRANDDDELPDPSESTPLLASSSQHPLVTLDTSPSDRWRWDINWRRCARVFLTSLACGIVVLLVLILIAARRLSRDVRLEEAVRWQIDDVRVLNVTSAGTLEVTAEVDATFVVDFDSLDSWEQSLIFWGIKTLDRVQVSSKSASVLRNGTGDLLATALMEPFELELPRSSSESKAITIPLSVSPTPDISLILGVVEDSWIEGHIDLVARVMDISVQGIGPWKEWLRVGEDMLELPLSFDIPRLPFLPHPPEPLIPALARTIKLDKLVVNPNHTVRAVATMPNPLPYFHLSPFMFEVPNPPVEVIALLPPLNSTTEASRRLGRNSSPGLALPLVRASPLTLTINSTSQNLTIPVGGHIIPIPSTQYAGQQISSFLSTYLAGLPSPVIISSPILENRTIPYLFPGPKPKPKILQEIKLSDMRMRVKGLDSYVSGKMEAVIALPKGFNLEVNVRRAAVDLLIYDGSVPAEGGNATETARATAWPHLPALPRPHLPSPPIKVEWPLPIPGNRRHDILKAAPPPHPLPEPIPERAFARIRPEEWLNATSLPIIETSGRRGEKETGTRMKVYARFEDVPLKILPGRDKIFRAFIRKFLFSEETLTGIKGFAGVGVVLPGLVEGTEQEHEPGVLELLDLPFDGAVMVGKGNL